MAGILNGVLKLLSPEDSSKGSNHGTQHAFNGQGQTFQGATINSGSKSGNGNWNPNYNPYNNGNAGGNNGVNGNGKNSGHRSGNTYEKKINEGNNINQNSGGTNIISSDHSGGQGTGAINIGKP